MILDELMVDMHPSRDENELAIGGLQMCCVGKLHPRSCCQGGVRFVLSIFTSGQAALLLYGPFRSLVKYTNGSFLLLTHDPRTWSTSGVTTLVF